MLAEGIEAGIDWVSMSVPIGADSWVDWNTKARAAIQLVADHGNMLREARILGYEGVQAAQCYYGERLDGSFLRITGAWADKLFLEVYHNQAHFSRVDMQVTARYARYIPTVGPDCHQEAVVAAEQTRGNRKRQVRQVRDNSGGYSVYIGARTSESYGNIYDKEAESGDAYYQHCWRFEVRTNNETATRAAAHLFLSGRTIPAVVSSTVWRWFHDRGVNPPWTKTDENNAVYAAKAPETDISRSLRWLAVQVGPTVKRLIELGHAASVVDALGLDASAAIPARDEGVE